MITAADIRENDTKALAEETVRALGVNGKPVDAEHIMGHSIAQACLEIEVVEKVLEGYHHDDALANLMYLLMGIRGRLTIVQNGARTLDRILNGKPWEVSNG